MSVCVRAGATEGRGQRWICSRCSFRQVHRAFPLGLLIHTSFAVVTGPVVVLAMCVLVWGCTPTPEEASSVGSVGNGELPSTGSQYTLRHP